MTEGSRRAVLYAFFANLGIAITKFAGFLITASASLLAEAVHSLADTGNQALLLLGGKRARKAADRDHPFGYGRERYFWAFVVALVLFSMGGLFALYEGIEKVRHPHEVENLGVAIGILLIAIVLESISLRTAYKEAGHVKGDDVAWWTLAAQVQATRAAGRAARGHRRRDRPVLRPHRRAPRPLHRRAPLGRRRLDRHRCPARRHRHRPRHRDEGPADRRGGVRPRPRPDRQHARGRRRRPPADPPQDPAPRSRRAARRRQAGVLARADARNSWRSASTAPRRRCGRRCRSLASSTSSPTSTAPPRRRDHGRRRPAHTSVRLGGPRRHAPRGARLLQQLVDRQVGRHTRRGRGVLADDHRRRLVVDRHRRPADDHRPAGAVSRDVAPCAAGRVVLRAQHHAVLHRHQQHEHRPRRVHHRSHPARPRATRRPAVPREARSAGADVGRR